MAVVREPHGRQRIVGHLCVEPDGVRSAEIAVAVADAYQRQGIGRRLIRAAVQWGRRVGLRRLDATAFATNAKLIALMRSLGLPLHIDWRDGPVCQMSLDLGLIQAAA